jgi:2-phosphoglycerate kinase
MLAPLVAAQLHVINADYIRSVMRKPASKSAWAADS